MNAPRFFLFLSLLLFFAACQRQPEETNHWQPLFNGADLSGWDTYLGAPHEGIEIPDSV